MDIVSFDDWVGEGEDKHFNRFFGIGWLFENDGIVENSLNMNKRPHKTQYYTSQTSNL